jgi:hypothetical protein
MKLFLTILAIISMTTAFAAEDVVGFLSSRGNKTDFGEAYQGLADKEALESILQERNYVEVLKHVWSEPDVEKRCAWLKCKAMQGHSLLFFELAEDYYSKCETLECYLSKAMPWMIAGATCVMLDAKCAEDPAALETAEKLLAVYQGRLLARIQEKYSMEELEAFVMEHEDTFNEKNEHVRRKVFTPMLKMHNTLRKKEAQGILNTLNHCIGY